MTSLNDLVNQYNFQLGSEKLTCSKCGMDVPLIDSYSNHGKHSICKFCAKEASERLNISVQDYIKIIVLED